MKLFEGFTEKTETNVVQKVEIGENDIRFIINGLPEPYKTRFNGYITEIIVTANAVRRARTIDDERWDEPRSEEILLDGPDSDAHDVPVKRGNAVASGHQESVFGYLGPRQAGQKITSKGNHQSSAWRGQE